MIKWVGWLVATGLFCAAWILKQTTPKEGHQINQAVLSAADLNGTDKMSMTIDGVHLMLEKGPQGEWMTDPLFPAKATLVNDLFRHLSELRVLREVDESETALFKALMKQEDVLTIGGKVLRLGEKRQNATGIYVLRQDLNKIWLINRDARPLTDIGDWESKRLVGYASKDIEAIIIRYPNGNTNRTRTVKPGDDKWLSLSSEFSSPHFISREPAKDKPPKPFSDLSIKLVHLSGCTVELSFYELESMIEMHISVENPITKADERLADQGHLWVFELASQEAQLVKSISKVAFKN